MFRKITFLNGEKTFKEWGLCRDLCIWGNSRKEVVWCSFSIVFLACHASLGSTPRLVQGSRIWCQPHVWLGSKCNTPLSKSYWQETQSKWVTRLNLLDSLSRETRKKDTLHCFGNVTMRSRPIKKLKIICIANAFTMQHSWAVLQATQPVEMCPSSLVGQLPSPLRFWKLHWASNFDLLRQFCTWLVFR